MKLWLQNTDWWQYYHFVPFLVQSMASQFYDLRDRRHNRQLPAHQENLLDGNFITRMCIKTYWIISYVQWVYNIIYCRLYCNFICVLSDVIIKHMIWYDMCLIFSCPDRYTRRYTLQNLKQHISFQWLSVDCCLIRI